MLADHRAEWGVGGVFNIVLLLGIVSLGMAVWFSCARARRPWSLSTVLWTLAVQAFLCGRDGGSTQAFVATDRLPVALFERTYAWSNTKQADGLLLGFPSALAGAYWGFLGLLAWGLLPLARLADDAAARRGTIDLAAASEALEGGTLAACVGLMVPVLFDLLPHPVRPDQLYELRQAVPKFWNPISGRSIPVTSQGQSPREGQQVSSWPYFATR